MAGSEPAPLSAGQTLHCVNHPQVETLVRCSKCLDPICPKCAVRTPVGLRCPRCAWAGRSPLYVVQPQHGVIAALVALALSLLAGALIVQVGWFFAFFLSAPAGGGIGEAVLRITRGKRGRIIQVAAAGGIIVGAILGPWVWLVASRGTLSVLPANPLAYLAALLNASTIIYAVVASAAAVARLR